MTVRINKQKINLREKLAGFEDKVNATQSLDALVDTSRNIDITNLSTSGESIRNSGAIINNRFVPFGPHARVLDLANTPVSGGSADPDLKGFAGGFTDGRYGYFVPNVNGKIARVDLHDFSSIDVLDLNPNNTNGLKGFVGGFTDGRYGYFVPFNNGVFHGKIARVDLSDFTNTGVSVLDLDPNDTNGLRGFKGGFTDGRYGYFVPYYNGSVSHGKIARVDLSDFNSVSVLDLTNTPINGGAIDSTLIGFNGGFTDGRYGYFVPYSNGSNGKIARVDLSDFSSVDVLDLTNTDTALKGFIGGFTDGRYGYFVPYSNGSIHGKIARVDLNDFSSVSVLDLQSIDPTFAGFQGGFTDGRYGYLMPNYNTKIIRIDLNDFSTVDVLDVNGVSGGFAGGFSDGKYGYCVPNFLNNELNGVAARFQLFNGGNL